MLPRLCPEMHSLPHSTSFTTRNMDDFAKVNVIYASFFKNEPPCRSAIAVHQLPKGARFEIEATVAYPYANL